MPERPVLPDRPTPAPSDEGRHEPGTEEFWGESWYFDFAAPDGSFGGWLRMGLYPNLGVTWYHALFVREGKPLVAVADLHATLPAGEDLTVAAASGTATIGYDEPFVRWRVAGDATGVVVADPAEMYDDEPGSPIAVAHDLVWADAGEPYHYGVTTRYEIPCRVTGTVTIAGTVIEVDALGQRDHSWGVRDWWAFGWCWSAGWLDDGSAFHASDIHVGAGLSFGYRRATEGAMVVARNVETTEEPGLHGFPRSTHLVIEPTGLDLHIEPHGFAPVLLRAPDGRISRFPRALCRFRSTDGRTGFGWTEWNQP